MNHSSIGNHRAAKTGAPRMVRDYCSYYYYYPFVSSAQVIDSSVWRRSGMTTGRTNRVKAFLSTPARCFPDQIAIHGCGLQFAVRLSVFDRRIPSVEPRSHTRERERETRVSSGKGERRAGDQTYRESRGHSHACLSVFLPFPLSVSLLKMLSRPAARV